jgi:hypothetical protein
MEKNCIAVWIPYTHLKSHIDEDQDEVGFHIYTCDEGVIISFHNHIKSPTKEGDDTKNI